jgi:hypothetical protein
MLHSFTPVFRGAMRPWHAGVLYNRDARFAHRVKALLNEEKGLFVGDNPPNTVSDVSDYTIPIHAERRGLHHVLVQIRLELIADESGQRAWTLRLARLLPRAYQEQLSKYEWRHDGIEETLWPPWARRPLFSRKQPLVEHVGMRALGHKRKSPSVSRDRGLAKVRKRAPCAKP